jgi:hypothetical protein
MTVIKASGSIKPQQVCNQSQICDRRFLLSTVLATIPLAASAQNTPLTPYQQGQNLEYGLLPDGRIRKCSAAAQPNCISTSSFSDMYSPPWLSEPDSASVAIREFDSALLGISPDAELLENKNLETGGIYRRYKIPNPAFEYDIVEVLIAPQQPPYDKETPLVTFRSQAGTVKYVWPITQPVSDMGSQKNRMTTLRQRLGWRIMGGDCDVMECFKE